MENLAIQYGYAAIFLGTLVEGETFIVIGGFLAHLGYLEFAQVVAVATVGAYLGDIMYFVIGRFYGRALLEKGHRSTRLLPWLEEFMQRYHALWIFGVRYLWGMRWLAAVLAGSSKVRFLRYSFIDFWACLVWALLVGLLGYGTGEALEGLLGDLRRYETYLLIGLALAGITYGLLAYIEERRLEREE